MLYILFPLQKYKKNPIYTNIWDTICKIFAFCKQFLLFRSKKKGCPHEHPSIFVNYSALAIFLYTD